MTPPSPDSPSRRRALGRVGAGAVAAWGARAGLGGGLGVAATAAAAASADLAAFEVTRDDDGVHLSYAIGFELGRAVDDALAKSVPIFFVAEAEIYRSRWYWRDSRMARAMRSWRVVYQPLTSNFRVTTAGGLSQTYATRAEALATIRTVSNWKIADADRIEEGARHYIEFNWRLDTSQLARPMQIGIGGDPDWQLSVQRSQRIS